MFLGWAERKYGAVSKITAPAIYWSLLYVPLQLLAVLPSLETHSSLPY